MSELLAAVTIWFAGGLACLAAGRRGRAATLAGASASVIGCALVLNAALRLLSGGGPETSLWALPGRVTVLGSGILAFDRLSAIFLAPLALAGALAAISAAAEPNRKFSSAARSGVDWSLFQALLAGAATWLMAANRLVWLASGELVALALVALAAPGRSNGASEFRLAALSQGCLVLLTVAGALLWPAAASLDFADCAAATGSPLSRGAGWFLTLAALLPAAGLLGMPRIRDDLPHAAAFAAALLPMLGLSALLRVVLLQRTIDDWLGWFLIIVGLVGALRAGQASDLGRLAHQTGIRHAGITVMAVGFGLVSYPGHAWLTAVCFAAALLHSVNGALFQSLLVLVGHHIRNRTGNHELSDLPSLRNRMPFARILLILALMCASGLPPLNGFIGPFLVLLAAFATDADPMQAGVWLAGLLTALGVGAVVFLNVSSLRAVSGAWLTAMPEAESGPSLETSADVPARLPLIVLVIACATGSLAVPFLLSAHGPLLRSLVMVSLAGLGVAVFALLLATLRHVLVSPYRRQKEAA